MATGVERVAASLGKPAADRSSFLDEGWIADALRQAHATVAADFENLQRGGVAG